MTAQFLLRAHLCRGHIHIEQAHAEWLLLIVLSSVEQCWKGSMLWLVLLLLSGDVVPRLVVREEEAASLTLERLRAEAELVGSSRRPHPECAGVEEDLLEYTFTVLGAAGEETQDTATIATVRDLTIDRKVVNVDEAWIWGIVNIRSHHTISSLLLLSFHVHVLLRHGCYKK